MTDIEQLKKSYALIQMGILPTVAVRLVGIEDEEDENV